MRRPGALPASQLEEVVLFLEEHPGFSPELRGEDAVVWAFRIGGCFLTLAEMERLIATQPHFDAREAKLLMASAGASAPSGWS